MWEKWFWHIFWDINDFYDFFQVVVDLACISGANVSIPSFYLFLSTTSVLLSSCKVMDRLILLVWNSWFSTKTSIAKIYLIWIYIFAINQNIAPNCSFQKAISFNPKKMCHWKFDIPTFHQHSFKLTSKNPWFKV